MLLEHDSVEMDPQMRHVYKALRKNREYKGVTFPGTSPIAIVDKMEKMMDEKWECMYISLVTYKSSQ